MVVIMAVLVIVIVPMLCAMQMVMVAMIVIVAMRRRLLGKRRLEGDPHDRVAQSGDALFDRSRRGLGLVQRQLPCFGHQRDTSETPGKLSTAPRTFAVQLAQSMPLICQTRLSGSVIAMFFMCLSRLTGQRGDLSTTYRDQRFKQKGNQTVKR